MIETELSEAEKFVNDDVYISRSPAALWCSNSQSWFSNVRKQTEKELETIENGVV